MNIWTHNSRGTLWISSWMLSDICPHLGKHIVPQQHLVHSLTSSLLLSSGI